MRVPFLGGEGPLEEGMATPSSLLAWRIPWTEESGGYSPWGCTESDMIEAPSVSQSVSQSVQSLSPV